MKCVELKIIPGLSSPDNGNLVKRYSGKYCQLDDGLWKDKYVNSNVMRDMQKQHGFASGSLLNRPHFALQGNGLLCMKEHDSARPSAKELPDGRWEIWNQKTQTWSIDHTIRIQRFSGIPQNVSLKKLTSKPRGRKRKR